MKAARPIAAAAVAALLLVAGAAAPAAAHRLEVDAAAIGDAIEGEAFFDDGAPCREASVEVFEGEVRVGEARTDGEGRFRAALDAEVRARVAGGRLRVVVRDGAGHRAEALVDVPAVEAPDAAAEAAPAPPTAPLDADAEGATDPARQADAEQRVREARRREERREDDRRRAEQRRRADERREEDRQRRRSSQLSILAIVGAYFLWRAYRRRREASARPPARSPRPPAPPPGVGS